LEIYKGIKLPLHEREVAKWIIDNADGVCVDVGAGTGVHTKIMAQIPRVWRVYAFEPIPYNAEKIRSLKHPKIRVFQIALGKEEGTLRLYDKNVNEPTDFEWVNATAIVSDDAIGHHYETYIDVPMKPLNKIIRRADFIKIDVEGMEYDVILGAKGVYENAKMVIELHGWGNYDMEEFLKLLQETHIIVNEVPEKITVWHVFLIPRERNKG